MSGLGIFRDRVRDGAGRDIADAVLEAIRDDLPVSDAVIDVLTDKVIDRYSDKITAAMRRGGVDIEDGEPLTEEKIRDILADQMGVARDTLDGLNQETILAEIDRQASEKLSEALGFDVGSVLDADALAANIEAGLTERLETMLDDEIEKYLPAATIKRLRVAATWARSGLDKRLVQNALAQRAWRKSNKWVYV